MSERACDKKSRRGMESREIPEAHARRFIVRESYRYNFRKFEIVIRVVCMRDMRARMHEREILNLDRETLDLSSSRTFDRIGGLVIHDANRKCCPITWRVSICKRNFFPRTT